MCVSAQHAWHEGASVRLRQGHGGGGAHARAGGERGRVVKVHNLHRIRLPHMCAVGAMKEAELTPEQVGGIRRGTDSEVGGGCGHMLAAGVMGPYGKQPSRPKGGARSCKVPLHFADQLPRCLRVCAWICEASSSVCPPCIPLVGALQLAEQRRRNAAAAAAAPPRQPPPPPPPPHHQPSPIMVDAMPLEQVYGNPMLVAAPMPYSHAHGGGSGSGGGGYVPPPPPPPPPSHPPPHIQSPSYYAQPGAGYPAVQYGLQGAPYYGSQGQAVYGQPWPGAASGACVAS